MYITHQSYKSYNSKNLRLSKVNESHIRLRKPRSKEVWGRSGVGLGSVWVRSGADLGMFWGDFGMVLGRFLGGSGDVLGVIRG